MRKSSIVIASLLVLGAALGTLVSPAQAAEPKKWEFTLLAPLADAAPALADEMTCPEAGDLDGTFYKFIDLEGEYKHFKVFGPTHLFDEPEPAGFHNINDYDIDLYIYDAKCNDITPDLPAPWSGTHAAETKKPGRYVLVTYWSGIHPELPVTLLAGHSKIK